MLAAEIERQELVDERQVVVDAADLEDLLPAQAQLRVPVAAWRIVVALVVFLAEAAAVPAVLDVAIELDAELVGIQPRRASWPCVPEWWSA